VRRSCELALHDPSNGGEALRRGNERHLSQQLSALGIHSIGADGPDPSQNCSETGCAPHPAVVHCHAVEPSKSVDWVADTTRTPAARMLDVSEPGEFRAWKFPVRITPVAFGAALSASANLLAASTSYGFPLDRSSRKTIVIRRRSASRSTPQTRLCIAMLVRPSARSFFQFAGSAAPAPPHGNAVEAGDSSTPKTTGPLRENLVDQCQRKCRRFGGAVGLADNERFVPRYGCISDSDTGCFCGRLQQRQPEAEADQCSAIYQLMKPFRDRHDDPNLHAEVVAARARGSRRQGWRPSGRHPRAT